MWQNWHPSRSSEYWNLQLLSRIVVILLIVYTVPVVWWLNGNYPKIYILFCFSAHALVNNSCFLDEQSCWCWWWLSTGYCTMQILWHWVQIQGTSTKTNLLVFFPTCMFIFFKELFRTQTILMKILFILLFFHILILLL